MMDDWSPPKAVNALHEAVRERDLDVLMGLVEEAKHTGAQHVHNLLTQRDEECWGCTVDSIAPTGALGLDNPFEVAEYVLDTFVWCEENGVEVSYEQPDGHGATYLHWASTYGATNIVKRLIDHHQAKVWRQHEQHYCA